MGAKSANWANYSRVDEEAGGTAVNDVSRPFLAAGSLQRIFGDEYRLQTTNGHIC